MNIIAATDIPIRGSPSVSPAAGEASAPRPAAPEPRPVPPPAPEGENQQDPKDVEQAAEGVNAFLQSSGSHVRFALHKATERMMVEVVDDETQDVIRTIPSKELLDLAAKIDAMVGVLLDRKG